MNKVFENGDCKIQVLSSSSSLTDDPVGLAHSARLMPLAYGTVANFKRVVEDIEKAATAENLSGLWGPIGASTYFDYRLKLDHFEDPPFPGEPSHPRVAVDAFLEAGFSVERRYRSHELKLDERLTKKVKTISGLSLGLRGEVALNRESLSPESFMSQADAIYDLTHEMFKTHFGYSAIGSEAFRTAVLARVVPVICWHTSFVLRNEAGQMIGYSLNLRDPSDPGRVCLKTFGIDPRLPNRTRAFFSLFRHMNESLQGRYDRVLFCLIAQGDPTDRLAESIGPIKSMSYGLFYKKLN